MANLSDKIAPSGVLTPTGDGSGLTGVVTIDANGDVGSGIVNFVEGTIKLNDCELNGLNVTIADDAVALLTFPSRQGGFLFVTCSAQGTYPQINNYSIAIPVDFGTSPVVNSTMFSGAEVETNDSSALNGTTGSDGKLTIGVAGVSGTLYVENRTNRSREFSIVLL
jgi:hypothetical protein